MLSLSLLVSFSISLSHKRCVLPRLLYVHLSCWAVVPSGGLTLSVDTQKWGFSWKLHRRPPADIIVNGSLPPKTPLWTSCPWPPWQWFSREKLLKIFKLCEKKKQPEILSVTSIICILPEIGFKELKLVYCGKACFQGYTFCFTTFLVRPSTGAQQSQERSPKNVQMTLKDPSYMSKFKVLFVCLPEDKWPSNFGTCLKMHQKYS